MVTQGADQALGEHTMPASKSAVVRKRARPAAYARTDNSQQRIPQAEMPTHTLEEALKMPRAIIENYGGHAPRLLDVAVALNLAPRGGQFRRLASSVAKYGLTEFDKKTGGVTATELARRLVQPKNEEDVLRARREATLRPKIIHKFLQHYDGERFPDDNIAKKMLVSVGAPGAADAHMLTVLIKNAAYAGFFRVNDKGVRYVDLKNGIPALGPSQDDDRAHSSAIPDNSAVADVTSDQAESGAVLDSQPLAVAEGRIESKKVFITHGKNRSLLPDLKKLIAYGGFEPEIAIERESVSKPVPDKVIDGMRDCMASVIVIDADRRLFTEDGKEVVVLNDNVMIEVGAAMALYGRKFILLVQEGVQLPSNLQGLYQVRFKGQGLDLETGFRLLDILKNGELTQAK
jgi:predicted nucleotide-binding protein